MNKIFNILPSLTAEQNEKKAAGAKAIDNFTVKKCPLMDNFESMDPTTMWKPLIGTEFKINPKPNVVNANIIAQSCDHKGNKGSVFMLSDSSNNAVDSSNNAVDSSNNAVDSSNNSVDSSNNSVDSSNNVVKRSYMDMLPNIQGITSEKDADSIDVYDRVYDNDDDNDDENVKTNVFKLHTTTKIYAGALSLVGLFVLYRVVKKTI